MNEQTYLEEYLDRILAFDPMIQRTFSSIHRIGEFPWSHFFSEGSIAHDLAVDLGGLTKEDQDEIFRMLDEKLGLSKKYEEESLIKDRHKIMLRWLSFPYLNHTERRQLLDSFGNLSEEDQNWVLSRFVESVRIGIFPIQPPH